MDKKKWLWKRKSSERSPGDTESSGSFSSHSERYSDEQDALRESQSPSDSTQSPEITSKPSMMDEAVKSLTEKLSAALVNVSAKEDLVKQHAKVAEEAVAGWEKAENEVAAIKQQLEAAVQQNVNLEVRASHLDGALKECVRQLRQARDEHEKNISDAISEKQQEWDSTKAELEKQILELQAQVKAAKATEAEKSASMDPKLLIILETLEKENSIIKEELASQYKELETVIIERDLSTQAAEAASKLQLESIKKVAKLEAEVRKLQAFVKKSSPVNTMKPIHFYAESLTDSHSDSGERVNGSEPSCSDSWASTLILELEQLKNEKPVKNLTDPAFEIDIMDDFLEMERLAALHETKINTPLTESASGETSSVDNNPLRAELDLMTEKVTDLEKQLEKLEAEKIKLENALDERECSLKAAESCVAEAESKLNELQKKLDDVNKEKELLEFQLVGVEVETRTVSANVDLLKAEIEKECKLSGDLNVKCQELENERIRSVQETEIQQNTNMNGEVKLKQEDLAVAADKLAECQKTIASLGRQLKSLATLEDFLVDTSNIPGFSRAGPLVPSNGTALSKTDLFIDSDPSRTSKDKNGHLENGNNIESPPRLSSSSSSSNHVIAAKSRNGFGKFFSRSKSVVEPEN